MKKFLALLLALCLMLPAFALADGMTDGTYEGAAEGRFGTITVEVTVASDKIESVTVKEHHDSAGVSDLPLSRIPEDIVKYQSLGVDTVSGATVTSYGVINATANALEQAGADIKALRKVEVPHEELPTEDLTCDVVVVGSGMAGQVAAATAADQGANVILVEKQPYLGGTLIIAGGYLVTVDGAHVDDSLDDSLDRVITYYKKVNEDSVRQPDYDFFAALAAKTGAAIDYLMDTMGVQMETFDAGNVIMSHDVAHGAGMTRELTDFFFSKGGTALTGTRATEILVEDGKVIGIKVENRTGAYNIYAKKVIIATGGSTYDSEAIKANNPEMATIRLANEATPGATGDGAHMMEAIGAKMGNGPFIKSEVPTFPYAFRMDWSNTPNPGDKLIINAEGNRFCNENPMLNYMLNTYLLREASPAYYAIYDAAHTDEALLNQIKAIAEKGGKYTVLHADTVEALAEGLGMDAAALRATFDAYQAACEAGVDAEFGKDADHLVAYDEASGLYAIYLSPTSLGTIGGAITDEAFHVLNTEDQPIENLFAVGECATSTLFGDYYVGSFSLGLYTAAGKTAAETAVAEINAK